MIDWEAAGWYPSFWEYAIAIYPCRWDDDWHLWVAKVLDEYLNEYAEMDMLFWEMGVLKSNMSLCCLPKIK